MKAVSVMPSASEPLAKRSLAESESRKFLRVVLGRRRDRGFVVVMSECRIMVVKCTSDSACVNCTSIVRSWRDNIEWQSRAAEEKTKEAGEHQALRQTPGDLFRAQRAAPRVADPCLRDLKRFIVSVVNRGNG